MLAEELVGKVEDIMRECGKIIINAKRDESIIDAKEGHSNFVTAYDKMVQDIIEEKLLEIIPDAAFVGEEGDEIFVPDKGYVFIVDPIDGTTNFINDFRMSCISVGILKDREEFAGLVYDPYVDEMFTAINGKGAYLNGNKIGVSKLPREEGTAFFGTAPYNPEYTKATLEIASKLIREVADLRCIGTAAKEICNVACGRAKMYYEICISPWDHAGAGIILKEAGGLITDLHNEKLGFDKKTSVFARSLDMDEVFFEIISKTELPV